MPDTIQWLGQGGFLFTVNGTTVCVDPYLTDSLHTVHGKFPRLVPPPVAPPDLKADIVVSTHDHIDHLDEETVRGITDAATLFAGPDTCITHFKALGLPGDRLRTLNRNGTLEAGNAVLHAVYADHTEDSIGLVFGTDAGTVYLTGDSLYSAELAETVRPFAPDIVITCINGKLGNMTHDEAARMVGEVGPKTAVPCHYGMFAGNTVDPRLFCDALSGNDITCICLEYGNVLPFSSLV